MDPGKVDPVTLAVIVLEIGEWISSIMASSAIDPLRKTPTGQIVLYLMISGTRIRAVLQNL